MRWEKLKGKRKVRLRMKRRRYHDHGGGFDHQLPLRFLLWPETKET